MERAAVLFRRMHICWLMLVVAVIGVVLGVALREWRRHQMIEAKRGCVFRDIADLTTDFGDFTKVPLVQSPYLRDVAEPITLLSSLGEAASDNVWMGVVFEDAKHVERAAEYLTYVWAGEGIRDTLMLGQAKAEPRGPEERAFLGLLQRWYRRDAEARDFYDHLKRPDYFKLNERQQAKITGVSMLKTLLKRN